jgi:hypothetical protein
LEIFGNQVFTERIAGARVVHLLLSEEQQSSGEVMFLICPAPGIPSTLLQELYRGFGDYHQSEVLYRAADLLS